MSNYASMSAGLPYNYTSTPMYWQYMQQLQQQQLQQQQQYQTQTAQQQQTQTQPTQTQQMSKEQQQMLAQEQARMQMQEQINAQRMQQAGDVYSSQTVQQSQSSTAADGADDGKISFGSKVTNFFKGVGNFFKGMVCDENGFSLKRTLTTVGVAAAGIALTIATGGAAAPYLVAAGCAMGVFEVGKGAYKACTATTDAEAENAWQEIGSGATGIGLSIAGAKGALKSAGVNTEGMNCLQATGKCFQIAGKGTMAGGKAMLLHPVRSWRNAIDYYKGTMKPNFKNAFSYKNGAKNYADAADAKLEQQMNKIQEQIDALNAKDPTSPEITRLQNELNRLELRKSVNLDAQNTRETNAQRLSEIDSELAKPGLNEEDMSLLLEERADLYKKFDAQIKDNDAYLERLDNIIAQCKEDLKTATGDANTILKNRLDYLEAYKQEWSSMYKVDTAQLNITKAQMDIDKLNIDLKNAATDADKARITSRIEAIKNSIDLDKQVLRNENMLIAAKNTLPKVGMAIGSYHLNNLNFMDNANRDLELAMEQYYNQSMAQQQAYEQAMQDASALQQGQQVQYTGTQGAQQTTPQTTPQTQQTAQQTQQVQSNPAMTVPSGFGMQSAFMPLPSYLPQGSGLDFNSLYVSPYPDVF